MAYTYIPAFKKTNQLKNTDEFVIVVDGKEFLVTLKTLSDVFGNSPELLQQINAEIEALRNIVDALPEENPAAPKALKLTDTPTIDGIYKPTETGTYANAGGLIYNPTEGITYFIRTSGVWSKDVTPVNFIPTGKVEQGNELAVSGDQVFKEALTVSKHMVSGTNLIQTEKIVQGRYYSPGNNAMTDRADAFGIWLENLPVGNYFVQGRNLTGGRGEVAFFNSKADTTPVSNLSINKGNGGYFTVTPETPKYIFINIAFTNDITPFLSTFMVSKGTTAKTFEAYKEVFNEVYLPKTSNIADKAVKEVNLSDELNNSLVKAKPSNNVFDKDKIKPKGMLRSTGGITFTSPDTYAVTDFIPITTEGITISPNLLHANGYNALFDENFVCITETVTKDGSLPFVEAAKYAVFSIMTANSDSIMINNGLTPLPFEPLNPIYGYMKDFKVSGLDIKIAIPSVIPAVIDDNLQLYKSGVFVNCNKSYYDYKIVSSEGKNYPNYYELKPSESGNVTSSVVVKDSDGSVLLNKAFTIRKLAKLTSPATQKNILIVGASATASRHWPFELKRRLTTNTGDGTPMNPTGLNLSNISFVGRKTSATMDVNLEATGGWSWLDYTTEGRPAYRIQVDNVNNLVLGTIYIQGAMQLELVEINVTGSSGELRLVFYGTNGTITENGTLTKYGGSGDSNITYTNAELESYNPFWYNGKIDFINYANLYCNGSITTLITHCGVNDIFSSATMETIINRIRTFANAFFTDFPNSKLIVSSLPLPCPNGGMTWSYNASATNDYYTKALQFYNFFIEVEKLQSEPNYVGKLFHSPVVPQFDNENSYPTNLDLDPIPLFYVNNRNTKEIVVGVNGVHPTSNGSKLVADAIYRTLHLTGL